MHRCSLCDKWFCETHLKPKFPYFVDWDNAFDVQGDPEIKVLFHTEFRRKGGHSDFVYLRKTIEALDLEEQTRNKLIKQAMDGMMQPEKCIIETGIPYDVDEHRKRTVERLENEILVSSVSVGVFLILLGLVITIFGLLYSTWAIFAYSIGILIMVIGSWSIISGFKDRAHTRQNV